MNEFKRFVNLSSGTSILENMRYLLCFATDKEKPKLENCKIGQQYCFFQKLNS